MRRNRALVADARLDRQRMSLVACVGCMEAITPSSAEAWQVRGIEDLCVLHAATPRVRAVLPCGALKGVEHLAVGRVADGVDDDLQPRRRRRP